MDGGGESKELEVFEEVNSLPDAGHLKGILHLL
jgi:hypothetical protein